MSPLCYLLLGLFACGDKDGDTGHMDDHDHTDHTTDTTTDTTDTTTDTTDTTTDTTDAEPVVTACNSVSPSSTDGGDGSWYTELDSTSTDSWSCFSFAGDTGDLAFQQWTVRLNGGASGDGAVSGVVLAGEDYEGLAEAPDADQFTSDGSALLFEDWYDYDSSTHILTPKDYVYVVQGSDGVHYKLEMVSYYGVSDAGAVHTPAFRWAEIAAP